MRKLGLALMIGALAASLPQGAPAQPPPTSQRDVVNPRAVVAEVRRIIAERYVLPERRPRLDAVLAEGLRSGRYDTRDPVELARRIDADLQAVGRDGHLHLNYAPDQAARTPPPPPLPGGPGGPQGPGPRNAGGPGGPGGPGPAGPRNPSGPEAELERMVRGSNHGIRTLRVLAGNVRYIDVRAFGWIGEESEGPLGNVMRFLADGDAVIIDLRYNRGGAPPSVAFMISHFLEAGRPLASFQIGGRTLGSVSSFPEVPARMVGKPLYVLTSGTTSSAGEEFAGHVAGYRIGEIVGEPTAGAAFRNQWHPIAGGFMFSVSIGRTILASTGTDWEGTGIAPTMEAPVLSALDAAHAAALRGLARGAGAEDRAHLEAIAEAVEARTRMPAPALPLAAYSGRYGDRSVSLEGGRLYLREGRGVPIALNPVGGSRFAHDDNPAIQLTFTAQGGAVTGFSAGPAGREAQERFERSQ